MKNLKMFYIFVSMIIGGARVWSTEGMAIEDKENALSHYNVVRDTILAIQVIADIQNEIKGAHKEVYEGKSVATLRQLNKTFGKLRYSEESWENIAHQLNVYKWPEQNWKQSVGGHLFYPENVNDILASPFTISLVERIDMIWSFAISAKYHNPLGKYYLGWTPIRIRARYTDADRPQFLSNILRDSLNSLYQCQDHSDACYVLGVNLTGGFYQDQGAAFTYDEQNKLKIYKKVKDEREAGLRFYEKGNNLQNKLAALREKFYCRNDPLVQQSMVDEYLLLAKEGCGAAYVEAAKLVGYNVDSAIFYLEEAVKLNFFQALIELGILYEEREDFENSIKYYKMGGEKGIGKGYAMISDILLGGDISFEKQVKNLPQVSEANISESIYYFTLAGKANEPEGWDQLAILYHNLYKIYKKEEYLASLASTLEKGVRMGSSCAYLQIHNLFIKSMERVVQAYGRPPQADLYKSIERFLTA